MTSATPTTKRLPLIGGAAALAAFLVAVMMLGTAPHADGTRVLPLAEPYRLMVQSPSTAAGPLYPLLISFGFAAGVSKTAMPGLLAWAGVLCYAGSAALNVITAARLAERAGYERHIEAAGVLGGALIALNGWLAWHAVSGMETALMLAAISGTLWGVVTGRSWAVAAFGVIALSGAPRLLHLGGTLKGALETLVALYGGFSPPDDGLIYAPLLLNLLALIGAVMLLQGEQTTGRRLKPIMLVGVLVSIGVLSMLAGTGGRYRIQAALYPILVGPAVLAVTGGVSVLADRPGVFRRGFAALIMGSVGLFGVLSLGTWRDTYQRDTANIATHVIATAEWVNANTASDAVVATADRELLAFFTPRTLIGFDEGGGAGTAYETLVDAQPDVLITTQDYLPADLLGEVPYAVNGGIIAQPDWTLNGTADDPAMPSSLDAVDGLAQVDAINVASVTNEAAHDYEWWVTSEFRGLTSEAYLYSYREDPSVRLADGVRALNGGERFTVSAQAGQDLMLIGRFHQEVELALIVGVDGGEAGRWPLPAVPGEWLESRFVIPGELITTDAVTITLRVETPGPEAVYRPAYYWAYTGDITYPAFDADAAVTFGDGLHLIRVDAAGEPLQAGDTLPVTLRWGVSTPPQNRSLRVFLHLVDVNDPDTLDGLMAQADAEPGRGAHPFWTWSPGEVRIETMVLALPADLPAGQYDLLIGVYDPLTGARLPVSNGVDRGADRHYVMSFESQ